MDEAGNWHMSFTLWSFCIMIFQWIIHEYICCHYCTPQYFNGLYMNTFAVIITHHNTSVDGTWIHLLSLLHTTILQWMVHEYICCHYYPPQYFSGLYMNTFAVIIAHHNTSVDGRWIHTVEPWLSGTEILDGIIEVLTFLFPSSIRIAEVVG